jgi:putative membrane protein
MPDHLMENQEKGRIEEVHFRESQRIIKGGWRQAKSARNRNAAVFKQEVETKYVDFPLVCGLLVHQRSRIAALEKDGKKQIEYTKSNDSWLRTLLVLEGRALDRILFPWILVTANAIVWTLIVEHYFEERTETDFSHFENFFSLVLNSSLAFLLVFRLNRSAERFWVARGAWGTIIALGRCLVGGVLVHGQHDPINRDGTIRWIATFCIATMQFIRAIPYIEPETVRGILSDEELNELKTVSHIPLHAADNIRYHLKEIFRVDGDTSVGVAFERTQQLDTLEQQVNGLILQMGALERIRATPLPLVYVTHLRTFLLFFLLSMPYVWESTFGYSTIPIVFVTAFALLGLEGAAQEVEAPFMKNRTNHLNMDAFCLLMISNILQQISESADRQIKKKAEAQSLESKVNGSDSSAAKNPEI